MILFSHSLTFELIEYKQINFCNFNKLRQTMTL